MTTLAIMSAKLIKSEALIIKKKNVPHIEKQSVVRKWRQENKMKQSATLEK